MRKTLWMIVISLLTLAGSGSGAEMVLEAGPINQALATCDTLHHIQTCDVYHFIKENAVMNNGSELSPGDIITLNDQHFRVNGIGPAYYLDDGAILHPVDSQNHVPGLNGQAWIEVYPGDGNTYVSTAWTDVDQDGALSIQDAITFTGGTRHKVRDVRLNLRVVPVGD